MKFFGEVTRSLLVIVFLSPVLNFRAHAEVNVWETILEPTVYVKDLICDPDVPNRMYGITEIKFENGPKYYLPSISENEGRTWQPRFDGIGIDPEPIYFYRCRMFSSPTGQFVLYYVVQDPVDNFTRIYKSLDRGVTWSSWSAVDAEIQTIGISPSDPTIWVAGGETIENENGIFRSTDSGKTWDFMFATNANGAHHHVEYSRTDPNTIVMAKSSPFAHLIKSTDAGLTWGLLPTMNWGWNSSWDVTIHPVNPDIMIAAIMGLPRWTHFMCRTTDGGQTWSVFGPQETDTVGIGGSSAVHYDSRDPNVIYVQKLEGDVFWRSTNGGIDWELTLQDVGLDYTGTSEFQPRFVESPWDNNTVYINIDGVYVSRDKGHTWVATGQIGCKELYVHPTDSNYIYSICHEQSLFRSTDNGKTWHSAATGIPFLYEMGASEKICASRLEPNNLWISSKRSENCGSGELEALFRSTDYGATWEMLPDVPGDRIGCLYVSRHIPGRVICLVFDWVNDKGENNRIAISDDYGFTWREIYVPDANILLKIVEHNTDPRIWLLLGSTSVEGRFFRSLDEGNTWSSFGSDAGYIAMTIRKLITDPKNDSTLYLDCYKTLRSENLGETWSEWKELPIGHGFSIDPSDSRILFCGGYRSTDGGMIWTDNKEFATNIQFDSNDPRLIYRTYSSPYPFLQRMTISSEKPSVLMAGFWNSSMLSGLPSSLRIYAYTHDPDPNDKVTSVELFYQGESVGDRLYCESIPDSGLFYRNYDFSPSMSGIFNLQLRAKDRFGMLSDPWPALSVKEGE